MDNPATPPAPVSKAVATPIPPFSDISKAANDLLNKDFYHSSAAALEVKTSAPNGVNFKVNGKTSHESSTSGAIEGKYTDKQNGLTLTQGWTTANTLNTKLEAKDILTKGFKTELVADYFPSSSKMSAKANLHYQQSIFHTRAFVDLFKGPTATIDAVIGQDGFLAGGEVGYDVAKASITKYSLAMGYKAPQYTVAVTAANNLSVYSASYYQKVDSNVEAGAKAVWDSKTSSNVGLEVAAKYRHDEVSFSKAKINDRGVAAIAYNILLRRGVTLGLGASFDTTKMDQATHKVGASLTFEN